MFKLTLLVTTAVTAYATFKILRTLQEVLEGASVVEMEAPETKGCHHVN